MGMPRWWGERRFGLYLDVSLACVPAWAPIGAPADRYRHHLGEPANVGGERVDGPVDPALVAPEPVDAEPVAPGPLIEVLAHHRDRWGHIDRYDDFAPLLTFDRFDADAWTALTLEAGAGYLVQAARHHDGWCWWDAPATRRTLLDVGPRRNVLAELAAACERDDLVLGAFYSGEDADRIGTGAMSADEVVAAQLRDLVDRYGVSLLCTDGAFRSAGRAALAQLLAGPDHELVLDRSLAAMATAAPDGPGWPADRRVTTVCGDPPPGIVDGPWQLCRPIGRGMGHNRTETEAHQLRATDIVALLTETVAKGGNLVLAIGPAADGTIPELHRRPLREAGPWIRRHHHLLAGARPWSVWGDDDTRYWLVDDVLHAVDLSGNGHFAALGAATHVVAGVAQVAVHDGNGDDGTGAAPVEFAQHEGGLDLRSRRPSPLERSPRSVEPVVYRIDVRPRERAVELFAPTAPTTIALGPIVERGRPGDIVQLGDGVYCGPATVPDGVTVRGLGPDRTTVDTGRGPVQLGEQGRLEHLTARPVGTDDGDDRSEAAAPSVRVVGSGSTILGCQIDELLVEGHDAVVRATALRCLRAVDADRLLVSRCRFDDRTGTAIAISRGAGHTVDSCEFRGHRCAIRVTEASAIAVAGNHIEARWWGVHLERTDHAHVHRNLMIATMRAVDVDGGSYALIDGNAVFDGDSGCVIQRGAAGCEISGNHWERCRIGVLGWEVGEIREVDNHAVDLHEPENRVVLGP